MPGTLPSRAALSRCGSACRASPLWLDRRSGYSVSGQSGVPLWPGCTRLSLGVRRAVVHCGCGHPLRFYIRPHFVKWSPVAALKLRLMSPTAARPRGFTKQALCKVSFAGSGGGVAPGHQSGAARTVGVSGLRPCSLCVPPPAPPGPRRCAAWAPRAPAARPPPKGAPSSGAPHFVGVSAKMRHLPSSRPAKH
jgi:hypothetical protein